MSDFEIKVVGAKPPRKPDSIVKRILKRTARTVKAVLMRPRLLTGAGLIGFTIFGGTPHLGWDYQCNHPMRTPGTCVSYDWCAYYGIQGRQIVFPDNGESCAVIKVLPIDWAELV